MVQKKERIRGYAVSNTARFEARKQLEMIAQTEGRSMSADFAPASHFALQSLRLAYFLQCSKTTAKYISQ
jgi:hypothetical protein